MGKRITAAALAASLCASVFPGTLCAGAGSAAETSGNSAGMHAYEPFAETEEYSAPHMPDTVIFAQEDSISLFGSEDDGRFADLGLSDIEELELDASGEITLFSESPRVYRAHTEGGVEETVEALEQYDDILYAEPEYIYFTQEFESAAADAGEAGEAQQWYLDNVDASKAWNYLNESYYADGGSSDTVIAVIDTGVDYNHKDLAHSMWINTGEIPGNGIDDDGNGYVDDIHGCSTVSDQRFHSGDPMDDHGHGTHAAGVIGMQPDNGTGGTGLAYGCRIMAIKAGQASGTFSSADIAEAIDYASSMGADVINMSFGSYAESEVVRSALERASNSCVLVAAAGNDGLPALPAENGRNMYPAAYNWVIGVMSGERDGSVSSFSNYDPQANSGGEYELTAPGSGIYSTLPGDRYAVWSGTSMAAPMVSAAAALLRSKYFDKTLYSSRFIMGQLVSTGYGTAGNGLNIYESLMNTTQPGVVYNRFYVFDTDELGEINDNDGIVDAGETVDLGVVVKNKWGAASDVNIKIDALINGMENPYVEILEDEVDYGGIGAFNEDDNGLIYSSDGDVTGVSSPFRIRVSGETPNDTVIRLNLTITARNAADPSDNGEYISNGEISFLVQSGRELGGVIREDMTLTKDTYWIINRSMRIEEGVTVNVEPGTQLQFWSTEPQGIYDDFKEVYIIVDGTLNINGTEEEPVEMFPGMAYANYPVSIKGNAYIKYANIQNPALKVRECDHIYGVKTYDRIWVNDSGDNITRVIADRITNSRVENVGINLDLSMSGHGIADCVQWNEPGGGYNGQGEDGFSNSVFLIGPKLYNIGHFLDEPAEDTEYTSVNNAILGRNIEPDPQSWLRVIVDWPRERSLYFPYNYWGTDSAEVIDKIIVDHEDYLEYGKLYYEPYLTEPAESTYPCVADISVFNSNGEKTDKAGLENITVKVTFNRDMDTSVQPMVSFGPSEPYTDFVVSGGWQDARTWAGSYGIKPSLGNGRMLFRVKGAVAADDPWLVTGNDWGRFQFEIITAGTEAMVLQAQGGENKIELSWMQDDYETLAGYNIYRATDYGTGYYSYSKINDMLIPKEVTTFTDNNVNPDLTYYYKFTVVLTDFTETDASPGVPARALDSIPPVIEHAPAEEGAANTDQIISAEITDNEQVVYGTLYYRAEGSEEWKSVIMQHGTGNSYFGTIPASYATGNIEYYIEAGDGVSASRSGAPASPYLIRIDDRPYISSFLPDRAGTAGGETFIINGANFTEGARVYIGNAEAEDISAEGSTRITGVLPPNTVGKHDVRVTVPDGREAVLVNALDVTDDRVKLQLVSVSGKRGDEVIMPVTAENAKEFSAVDISVSYDRELLEFISAVKSEKLEQFIMEYGEEEGLVRISMASAEPFYDDTELCFLKFRIKDDVDFTNTQVNITNAMLNGSDADTVSGAVTLAEVYTVSGKVSYYSHNGAVSGAELSFGRGISVRTDESGNFVKSGLPPGEYSVSASRSGGQDCISAYDAALALQKAVGRRELDEYQIIAADVNEDGTVNAMDASLILKAAAGNMSGSFYGSNALWKFDPQSVELELNNDKSIQFTAVELGDVSGNWGAADILQSGAEDIRTRTYHVPEGCMSFEVPVKVDALSEDDGIIGIDIGIELPDKNIGHVTARLPESLAGSCMLEEKLSGGVLRIAVMSSAPIVLQDDEPVIMLNVKLNEMFSGSMSLKISELMLNESEVLADACINIEELEAELPETVPEQGEYAEVSVPCLKTDVDMSGTAMYTAAYDKTGRLVYVWKSGYNEAGFYLKELISQDIEMIKVFLWDEDIMRPVMRSAQIKNN